MKRFLILGSNSFSGHAFCTYLRSRNENYIAISRSKQKPSSFRNYPSSDEDFVQLDLNQNSHDIIDIIKSNAIDVVVNFASQSMVGESWDNPSHWYKTNVLSTCAFYDLLSTLNNVKLVHVSTPEVYGSCNGAVLEGNRFNPTTPYAVSRSAADYHLRNLGAFRGLNYVITRASNVYGECQDLYRLIPKAIHKFYSNKVFQLHGGGTSRRNFIHIDDVCTATYMLSTQVAKQKEYHISGERLHSIHEVVSDILQMFSLGATDLIQSTGERLGKDDLYYLDSGALRGEFGWTDAISLPDGMNRVKNWYFKNADQLQNSIDQYVHRE